MFTNIPQLKFFCIDYEYEEEKGKELVESVSGIAKLGAGLIPNPGVRTGIYLTAEIIKRVFGDESVKLKRLLDENLFTVIQTPEALKPYQNAQGNDWITKQSLLKKKQYYVQHPKKARENVLIESQSFCEYIEKEQKEELIDFILSHCRAKSITIEKVEESKALFGAKVSTEVVTAEGGLDYGKQKGENYYLTSPRPMRKKKPRKEYLWLDEWAKETISSLKRGARFEQTYVMDFSFGLVGEEARFLGLKLAREKKQRYHLLIEC